jgi:hypothetical protein
MDSANDLRRAEELVAEERRIVQQQKGPQGDISERGAITRGR